MTDQDRELIKQLIEALTALAGAIHHMPRGMSVTHYPADYRPPGGGGGGYGSTSCNR